MPEYIRAAGILAATPSVASVVALGTVNSVTARDLTERLGVETFPTFFLYRAGVPEPFPTLATGEAYVAGLARMLGLAGADALSPAKDVAPGTRGADLASWLFWRGADTGRLPTTLALFSPPGAPAAPALVAAFDAASALLFKDPNIRFLRVRSDEAMADLEMDIAPGVAVYKEHDEGRVDYAGELTGEAMAAWLKREAVPLVTLITHKTLQRYRSVVKRLALLFVEGPQAEHLPTLRKTLDAAHKAVYALEAAGVVERGAFTLGVADGEKYVAWREQFGLAGATLPVLALEDVASTGDSATKAGTLFAFPDAYAGAASSWARDALCSAAAAADVGPHDKWTVDLSRSCPADARSRARERVFTILPDGSAEVPDSDVSLPPVGDDSFAALVVSALEWSDALVEAMRAWIEAAVKGDAEKVPTTRVKTPFGEAVA